MISNLAFYENFEVYSSTIQDKTAGGVDGILILMERLSPSLIVWRTLIVTTNL